MGRPSRHFSPTVPHVFHVQPFELNLDTQKLKLEIKKLLHIYPYSKDFGTLDLAFFLEDDVENNKNLIVILSSSKAKHPSFLRFKDWFLSQNINALVKKTFKNYYNFKK